MLKGIKRWFVQRLRSHHTSNNVEPCLRNAGVALERHDLSTLDPNDRRTIGVRLLAITQAQFLSTARVHEYFGGDANIKPLLYTAPAGTESRPATAEECARLHAAVTAKLAEDAQAFDFTDTEITDFWTHIMGASSSTDMAPLDENKRWLWTLKKDGEIEGYIYLEPVDLTMTTAGTAKTVRVYKQVAVFSEALQGTGLAANLITDAMLEETLAAIDDDLPAHTYLVTRPVSSKGKSNMERMPKHFPDPKRSSRHEGDDVQAKVLKVIYEKPVTEAANSVYPGHWIPRPPAEVKSDRDNVPMVPLGCGQVTVSLLSPMILAGIVVKQSGQTRRAERRIATSPAASRPAVGTTPWTDARLASTPTHHLDALTYRDDRTGYAPGYQPSCGCLSWMRHQHKGHEATKGLLHNSSTAATPGITATL